MTITPTTLITKRRSLVAAIIVVAVAAAVLVGAAGPSGSTAADAPDITTTTTVPTTTTTIPSVGELADEADLARLTERAEEAEEAARERLRRFYEGLAKKKAEEERRREAAAKKLAEPAPAPTSSPAPAPEPSAPPPTPAPGGGPADRVAAAHGLTVRYGDPTPCGTSGSANYVAGCFLSSTPNVIYMSGSALDPGLAGVADSVARHEAGHALAARVCGSALPPIASGRHEQVTDAYAHLFLGAGPSSGGYGYTASDAAIARSIRAGDCGRSQPPPLPAAGAVSAHIGSHSSARQTVMSPRPSSEVGSCRTVSAPAGWGATCDGGRVIVTAPSSGATPGSTAAFAVQTDRGWSYRITLTVR